MAALASPVLAGVPPALVGELLAAAIVRELAAGTTLLAPGDRNASLYLVAAGRLMVHLEDPGRQHHVILQRGDCVGEVSFIDGRSASAHVVASVPSRVLAIDAEAVWALIEAAPEFARNLLRVLASRVRNDNTSLQRNFNAQREYEQAVKTDLLTGIHNRRWMEEMFPRQLARSEHAQQPVALVLADIDRFRHLNDAWGSSAGDAVLQALARVLSEALRPSDFLVRYGGEEFVAMLPGATQEVAGTVAERLRNAVEQARFLTDLSAAAPKVTISLGVALFQPGEGLAAAIERADAALRQAKACGRNRVSCAP